MISLRDYQQQMIEDGRSALARIRKRLTGRQPRLLFQLPPGGGKTILAAFMADQHIKKGGRVHFRCHRDFLLDQSSKSFMRMPIQHTYVAPKRYYSPNSRCHIGMVQTLGRRDIPAPTLAIWDEGHHILASTWLKIMDAEPNTTHILLSATPIRTNGEGFDGVIDDIVCGPSVTDLIGVGALADFTYYAPDTPDLAKYHTRAGDYKQEETDADMGKAKVIGNLVGHYHKLAPGKRAIYYCTSVKNSNETAAAFRQAGYNFVHLDGKSSSDERRRAARAMASGEVQGFTNVDLMGEGFDLAAQSDSDLTVQVVGLARPTKSKALSEQQRMRCMRPQADGSNGIIFDHAGHLKNFGLPDDPVIWGLSGAKVEKTIRLVECDDCGAKLREKHSTCPQCGGIVKAERKSTGGGEREVEFVEGDLKEIARQAAKAKQDARYDKLREQDGARTLSELIELGRRRGHKMPEQWAAYVYQSRMRKGKAA